LEYGLDFKRKIMRRIMKGMEEEGKAARLG